MSETFSVANEPPEFYTRAELLLALRTLLPSVGLVDGVTITINGEGKLQISGALDAAFISSLPAGLIVGELAAANIPIVPWEKVESGTLPLARVPVVPKEKVGGVLGSLVDGVVPLASKANTVAGTYDSGWIASGMAGTDKTKAFAHSLGNAPGLVQVWVRWTATPPTSWSINEAIAWECFYMNGASGGFPVAKSATATDVTLIFPATAASVQILDKTSMTNRTADLSTAEIRIVARLTSQTGT